MVRTALFAAAADRARSENQPHLDAALAHLGIAVAQINDALSAIEDARKGGARGLYFAAGDLLKAIDLIDAASGMLRSPESPRLSWDSVES